MWQYDEFLKQHIEKARRLLAESDDLRGSTDLQMFLECFDANEQLHQLWLDASHQPRPGLTPQQKQQAMTHKEGYFDVACNAAQDLAKSPCKRAYLAAFLSSKCLANALMLHPSGWSPAEVQQALAMADRSRKLAKIWVLPASARHMRDLLNEQKAGVAADIASHPGRARLPALFYHKSVFPMAELPHCACCGKGTLQLSKCAARKQVAYCSRDCQVRHWKEGGHKAERRRLAAAAQAGEGSGAGGGGRG
ncbi:HIT MYND zinc finger isoform B [Chlorella sorokiniana]|uniref:HIT MYND zinc finger isoform B n=1 Tax=Chlorella sorokiniana TaxID=3076 RepID=A0A2P6THW8_CHLSO|nr:HIT MYND zinc finger isoform B [Chlorella sorokiniana]|eukprot:PRW33878.1 HIT MYND zinc finger isoform B [Chlorella sorokiniana]